MLVFDEWSLAPGHWAHGYVRMLDEEPVSVEAVNPGPRSPLVGRRIEATVLACEAVEVGVGDDRVVIRDDAVYRSGDNTILVPENESSGKAVRQVSNYLDRKGDWCEADECADAAALAEAITLLRSTNPAGAFLRLIAEARPERYPSLRGRRFTVEVGETPHEHRVACRGLSTGGNRLPASGRASSAAVSRDRRSPRAPGRQAKESRYGEDFQGMGG